MRETGVRFLGGKIPWRRKWQSTPALLPGKSHERRSLIGYSPWGRKELDTTEQLHFHFLLHCRQILHCLSHKGSPKKAECKKKKINPDYSVGGLMLKLPHLGHLMSRADSGKDPDAGKDWWQKEKGQQRMRWLDSIATSMVMNKKKSHESKQTLGDSGGQEALECSSPWSHKELDIT